jgi:hypothetical protein
MCQRHCLSARNSRHELLDLVLEACHLVRLDEREKEVGGLVGIIGLIHSDGISQLQR